MARSKGTLYVSARLYAEKTFGPEAIEACLAELSPADRDLLQSIVAVGWYPLEPILRFHRALDAKFGAGDLALCRDVGRFSAEWQLNSFHKLYLRFRSPVWMIERASTVWRQYHDTGRWEIATPEPGYVCGRLLDFAVVDAAFCAREQGWFIRATELTGVGTPALEERRCTSRGDSYCEFVGRWGETAQRRPAIQR